METGRRISPHETFELHEILTLNNICATKSSAMSVLVKDEALKTLLEQNFIQTQAQIKELLDLIHSSGLQQSPQSTLQ